MLFRHCTATFLPKSRFALRQSCPVVASLTSSSSSNSSSSNSNNSTLAKILEQQLHLQPAQAARAAADLQLDAPEDVQCNLQYLLQLAPHSCLPRIQHLVATCPAVLACPLASWSSFLQAYGMPEQSFLRLLWSQPEVIIRSSPYSAGLVILALRAFGLDNKVIYNSVLARAPSVLLLDVQQQLLALQAFAGQYGLTGAAFRDLLACAPGVMLQNVQAVLAPRLQSLQQELGASQEQVAAMLQAAPGLLLLADTDTYIWPRLQLLQSFGFSRSQLLQLLTADAALLSNSLATLQRKWQFANLCMGLGPSDVLLQCPCYFSRSLLVEVGPRYSYYRLHMSQATAGNEAAGGLQAAGSWISSGGRGGNGTSCEMQPPEGAHDPQQQEVQQQQQQQQQHVHLGRLLLCSLAEFLEQLGLSSDAGMADYLAFRDQWPQKEGLGWNGVRAP